jgi:hypothetical protein
MELVAETAMKIAMLQNVFIVYVRSYF